MLEQQRDILGEIEARLGLGSGAIGRTHDIDGQAWAVVKVEVPVVAPAAE